MSATVSIEVPREHESIVRQALALQEELAQLALSAPHGTVLDACEEAVILKCREVRVRMLQRAVARRTESAEKRGRRSASAPAVDPKKTADPKPADSPPPSAPSPRPVGTGSAGAESRAGRTPSTTYWG